MVSFDRQLERASSFLAAIPAATERAAARALNRAAAAARDQAVDSIVERYAVNPSDIRGRITQENARPESLGATITARSGSLALGYFPHIPSEVGTGGPGRPVLRAEILRGQEKSIPGAFVATINGRPRIMIHTGGTSRSMRSVYTVPFASMLGASSVVDAVEDRAAAVLDEQLGREIDRELKK